MSFAPLALFALAFPHPLRQHGGAAPAPPPAVPLASAGALRWSIPGTVKDLARDAEGRLLYCTAEREVGRLGPGGRTVLATAADFPSELRAVAELGGNVVLLDVFGHVRVLFGGLTPAVQVYADQYMILDASDLIVDARGSYLIASATPSSGQRGINWISSDGDDWSYYLVKHQPLALAHDPLTGGILMSETTSGGNLRLVQAGSPIHATVALDTVTHPGLSVAQSDGDLAVEAGGDLFWIAGGSVRRHRRATGATTLAASGFAQLRGAVIAEASGLIDLGSLWSLYLAEGANPTRIVEALPAGAPASLVANDQGDPPGLGRPVGVTYGFTCLDLATDQGGKLLMGGTTFGSGHFLKRLTLPGTPNLVTLASSADGLIGPVEGVCIAPDHSLYTLSRGGTIQHITFQPITVTTVFVDPANDILAGKDLALDVDGSFYVACRDDTDLGKVLRIAVGGSTSTIVPTEETRGLAAKPLGGMYFSQWRNAGFQSTVDLLHFAGPSVETLPGFSGLNLSNDEAKGDGDICVDAAGNVFAISEDDWALVRYHADLDGIERMGSGYLNHPSGLAIAASTSDSGSTTGWSLYVSEFTRLWEFPSSLPPSSPLVDATLGLSVDRSLAGVPHPRYGKPSALAPTPSGLLIGTQEGWLLALDPCTGAVQPVVGPEQGLRGELVALATSPGGRRTLLVDAKERAFELVGRRLRPLAPAPATTARILARVRAEPQHRARLRAPGTGEEQEFALDGWAVWRVNAED